MSFNNNINRTIVNSSNEHCVAQNRLKGKIAAVTASTEGIGLAIAKRIAQEGATVIISSRKQYKVDAAVSKLKDEGLNVTGLVCHVSNGEDRKRLFDKAEEFGGLDILISNAGVNPVQVPIVQYHEELWNKVFNVNVTASFLLAKEAYPLMKKRGGGSIVFLSSIAAFHSVHFPIGAYAVSKTALLGLTKVFAEELGKDNIRVNCVAPGAIETRFGEYITKNASFYSTVVDRSALKRIGKPEDISGIMAFLASDDAQFITGENIVVAGGVLSRL